MQAAKSLVPATKVVVVEEEQPVAKVVQGCLARAGFQVVSAVSNAEGILRALDRDLPEAVVVNARLKRQLEIAGLTAKIRAAGVAIVYLTIDAATAPNGRLRFRQQDLLDALEAALLLNHLERRLRASELLCSSMLASIDESVIATNGDGLVTFMNHQAEAMTGWDFADAECRAIEDILTVADENGDACLENPIRRALRQGKRVMLSASNEVVGHGGCRVPIQGSASAMVTATGEVTGAVLAVSDRIGERELEAIAKLGCRVAHEFNNLLTIINGCADLALYDKTLTENTKSLLVHIGEAGQRAISLTTELLQARAKSAACSGTRPQRVRRASE